MYRQLAVTLIAIISVGSIGLVQGYFRTSAQEGGPAVVAGPPLVVGGGARPPLGASAETSAADGSFVAGYPDVEQGPRGPAYYSAGVGVWESTGPQSGHFTA